MTKSQKDDYKPGHPEYDFWNDKNLYPGLRHDDDFVDDSYHDNFDADPHRDSFNQPSAPNHHSSNDASISGFSVFAALCVWTFIFAPFALFLNWTDWIVQVVFWGGLAIVVLVFLAWIFAAIEAEKRQRPHPQPDPSLDLPLYKKYPPADVLQARDAASKRDKKY